MLASLARLAVWKMNGYGTDGKETMKHQPCNRRTTNDKQKEKKMNKVSKLKQDYENAMAMTEVTYREDQEKNPEIKEKVEVEMEKLAGMIGHAGVQELVDLNGIEVVLHAVAHMKAEDLGHFVTEDPDGGKDKLDERILAICGFSIMDEPETLAEIVEKAHICGLSDWPEVKALKQQLKSKRQEVGA